MKCYNYRMLGHFTCEYTKPKKVYPNPSFHFSYVFTHALVAHSLLEGIVDSQATKTKESSGICRLEKDTN